MGQGFECIYSFKTNPGAVISATAAAEGQSLQIKAGQGEARIENLWAFNAAGGLVRVRCPAMHDNVQGVRARVQAAITQLLLPYKFREPIPRTETLTIETTGGEAETDCVFTLVHYDDLPGESPKLARPAEVYPNIESYMGVEVAIKTGAVGHWGTPVALNTSMDLFKKPANYAILGYVCSVQVGAIALQGGDLGNVRIAGPGTLQSDQTGEWFARLSEEAGEAAIPVFNSQNVGQLNVEAGGGTAELETKVTFLCAKLRS